MVSKPIIFLDVDGVLNRTSTRPGEGVRECVIKADISGGVRYHGVVEIAKVEALRALASTANAQIVVSSSWRHAFETADEFAAAIGIAPPLADAPALFHKDWRTGWKFSSQRFHEIGWWLDDHRHANKPYVIFDDHSIVPEDWSRMFNRFIQTDPEVGLTENDIKFALEILKS